jgi:hypothetical protein
MDAGHKDSYQVADEIVSKAQELGASDAIFREDRLSFRVDAWIEIYAGGKVAVNQDKDALGKIEANKSYFIDAHRAWVRADAERKIREAELFVAAKTTEKEAKDKELSLARNRLSAMKREMDTRFSEYDKRSGRA